MKPPAFTYYAPTDLDEALHLLHELVHEQQRDVKLLAGGQSLVPLLNMRLAHPDTIIDLNLLEPQLSYVRHEDSTLRIGALSRHYMLRDHPEIMRFCPVTAEAVRLIGHAAILTRGTIGGSLVHADPAAELPVVCALLGGSVTLCKASGCRNVPTPAFFVSYLTTSVEPDEILTEVTLPALPPRSGQAIEEFAQRHGDFALAVAAAQITLNADGTLANLRLCIGGAGPTPIDGSHIFASLAGRIVTPEDVRDALRGLDDELDPLEDIHADAAYRKELARVMAFRAIERAWQRARRARANENQAVPDNS